MDLLAKKRTVELMCDLLNGDRGRKAAGRLGEWMRRQAERSGAVRGSQADPAWLATLCGVRSIEKNALLTKSGRLERDASGYRVYLPAGEPQRRRRFTLAHEVAHVFFLANRNLDVSQDGSEAMTEEERRCDLFAASFLMPRSLFQEKYNRYSKEKSSVLSWITALGSEFDVTETAIVSRLKGLDCLRNSGVMILIAEKATAGRPLWPVVGGASDRPAFLYALPDSLDLLAIEPPSELLKQSSQPRTVPATVTLDIWGRSRRGMPQGLNPLPCVAEYRVLSRFPRPRIIVALESMATAPTPQQAARQQSFLAQGYE